ncbi:MAG: SDR family oxidoreductase [Bacilli bacterium]|nr:SDR family oxidoreductase [Bacilli bacterium]
MKTVVITGSARGFGFEMLKLFRSSDFNVVCCDISKEALTSAQSELEQIKGKGKIIPVEVDITKESDVDRLIESVLKETSTIDIWINNAGVNQPNKPIWELDSATINRLIDIDLKGTILCSKKAMNVMTKQGFGGIYNVEGHGSNDATILGLSVYGTAKRAVTYFTEALAYEAEKCNTKVLVGKITPGIMITNFIHTSLGDGEHIELDEKTKKVYNILGDRPETIAAYIVPRIIYNTKNNAKFVWLTNRRAAWRFMTSWKNKNDYFKN